MRIGKTKKYRDIAAFPNVMEVKQTGADPAYLAGSWNPSLFRDPSLPLVLELGCGRGDFTLFLARRNPCRNVLGIDIKGARLWAGARRALQEDIGNAAYCRMPVDYLGHVFPPRSIHGIWITFPDPHDRKSWKRTERRLTSSRFLDLYGRVLEPGGVVHLKTDHGELYTYSLETVRKREGTVISASEDLYRSGITGEATDFQTAYEKRFLAAGKPIRYLRFTL